MPEEDLHREIAGDLISAGWRLHVFGLTIAIAVAFASTWQIFSTQTDVNEKFSRSKIVIRVLKQAIISESNLKDLLIEDYGIKDKLSEKIKTMLGDVIVFRQKLKNLASLLDQDNYPKNTVIKIRNHVYYLRKLLYYNASSGNWDFPLEGEKSLLLASFNVGSFDLELPLDRISVGDLARLSYLASVRPKLIDRLSDFGGTTTPKAGDLERLLKILSKIRTQVTNKQFRSVRTSATALWEARFSPDIDAQLKRQLRYVSIREMRAVLWQQTVERIRSETTLTGRNTIVVPGTSQEFEIRHAAIFLPLVVALISVWSLINFRRAAESISKLKSDGARAWCRAKCPIINVSKIGSTVYIFTPVAFVILVWLTSPLLKLRDAGREVQIFFLATTLVAATLAIFLVLAIRQLRQDP